MIDLRCGDARDVLATLPDASVDAVVTDPPYALTSGKNSTNGFMSARWDNGSVAHDPAFWAEVLRVAKPGAFLLAFGGTRTYHRLACAIEDAGWECRDMLNWLQGSGFPKSKSCLKPAHEPIVLAKAPGPLQPLQIDACRVATGERTERASHAGHNGAGWGMGRYEHTNGGHASGRWPPNTLFSHVGGPDGCQPAGVRRVRGNGHHPATRGTGGLGTAGHSGQQGLIERHLNDEAMPAYACVDGCPIKALDEQAGPRTSGGYPPEGGQRSHIATYGKPNARGEQRFTTSRGAASRYFPTFGPDPEDAVPFRYCSKASRRDRGEGNTHSTVKPTNLMAWLCKLVTPQGGVVLDCFAGSGSTGVACVREGFGFMGIDMSAEYVDIARARIAHEQERRDRQLTLPLGHACG